MRGRGNLSCGERGAIKALSMHRPHSSCARRTVVYRTSPTGSFGVDDIPRSGLWGADRRPCRFDVVPAEGLPMRWRDALEMRRRRVASIVAMVTKQHCRKLEFAYIRSDHRIRLSKRSPPTHQRDDRSTGQSLAQICRLPTSRELGICHPEARSAAGQATDMCRATVPYRSKRS